MRNHYHQIFKEMCFIKDTALETSLHHRAKKIYCMFEFIQQKWKNANDFRTIARCLLSETMRDNVWLFQKEFKVKAEHQDLLDAINICFNYFFNFKTLHLLSNHRTLENPNRENNLRRLILFFEKYKILRPSSRNESFLTETIEKLIKLPVGLFCVQTRQQLQPMLFLTSSRSLI